MAGRRRYLSLNECLHSAFLNPDYVDPQAEKQIWAIFEGIRRLHSYDWETSNARKEHKCIRGCEIKAGDTYFKYGHRPKCRKWVERQVYSFKCKRRNMKH